MATSAQINSLTSLYVGYFDRAPDPAGLQAWINAIDAGIGIKTIAGNFADSAEAKDLYPYLETPGLVTPATFVGSIYVNLFNRPAETAGLDFWVAALESGAISPEEMILEIIGGAQGSDQTILNNKIEAGRFFAETAASASGYDYDIADAKSAIDGVTADTATVTAAKAATEAAVSDSVNVGTTFTLTTDTDVLDGTAANDTFAALIDAGTPANSTLTAADVVNGAAGTDVINVTVAGTGAGSLPAADISGVENFFIRDVNTGGASTYDFAGVEGEAQVWANRATQDVDFQNLGTGTVVGVAGNGTTDNGNVDFNMATATDAVSIVLSGGVQNSGAAPTITNTTAGAATAATLTSAGAANTVGLVTLAAAAGNSVETFDVVADSDLTAALEGDDFATDATLNISGAGDVDFSADDGATFDTVAAGSATGDLTLGANTTTAKVTTGSGDDTVDITAALVDGAAIALGAGDDAITVNGGSVSADVTVDGGDGSDTVTLAVVNAGNGANFSNFEVLRVDANATLDLDLLTGSTIASLALANGANATLQNVELSQSLSVIENGATSATLEFDDVTGADDSYSISFDAETTGTTATPTAVGAGTVTVDGVEDISIASGSAAGVNANSITLGSDTAETVTITGDQALTLDFAAGFGADTDGDEVTAIDGSAATGDLDIDVANVTADASGLTVTGGSGDDTLTTDGAAITLAGGAGDDTFEIDAFVLDLADLIEITDLTDGDVIDFSDLGTGAFNDTAVDVSAATTLQEAADIADATAGLNFFDYAGNTYVINADATATNTTSDQLVKLTGVVDLSDAVFDNTADTLTIA